MTVSCIYFMSTPDGLCKIGVAKEPKERLKYLQTGNPQRITLEGAWEIEPPIGTARDVERELHSMLSEHRAHGEWFRVAPDVAMMLFKSACEKLAEPVESVELRVGYNAYMRDYMRKKRAKDKAK